MMKTQNNARNNEELVYNDNDEIISGGNTSKVGLILLLSLITLLSLTNIRLWRALVYITRGRYGAFTSP